MNRSDVIDFADTLTERKGKQFDLKRVYARVVTNICRRYRFWWRKRYASFNVLQGTNTYDVTALTVAANALSPSNAFTEIMVEEIVRFFRVDLATSNPPQIGELAPIMDALGFTDMFLNTIQGRPGRYIMDYSDYKTIRVDPPDTTYQLVLVFWAMPNISLDSSNDAVPLIPPHYHNVIVDGMRADIFSSSYGEQNAKTIKAVKDYELGLEDMILRPQFTSLGGSQLISTDNVVRSTTGLQDQIGPINIPLPR